MARRGVLDFLAPGEPLVVAIDDAIVRKTGRHVPGTQYHRDPLGPPFQVNLVWAERVLQLAAALPPGAGEGPCRMVPVDFLRAPRPARPARDAPDDVLTVYRQLVRASRITVRGAQRLAALRDHLDHDGPRGQRPLWAVVDGRFTNRALFRGLPDRTVLIGRLRGDAQLYHLPPAPLPGQPGRHRVYGERAPTPEALRQDATVPWQTVRVWAVGRYHDFRVKTLAPLRWRSAGEKHSLRLLVIAPLGYRPRKGSKVLYRQPAYLICTDPSLPLEQILQAYVWRWDIEVNFRDEKQLLGLGDAQVRSPAAVETAPALAVAAYSLLLVAAARAFGVHGTPGTIPPPKWRTRREKPRATTLDLIQHLRAELWGPALGVPDFSGFSSPPRPHHNPEKSTPNLAAAVLYAVG